MNFADRLIAQVIAKKSHVVVGLDPRWGAMPPQLQAIASKYNEALSPQAAALAFHQFGREIIDAVSDVAVAIKLQVAFYEQYGPWGMHALVQTVKYAREQGLLVIADAKRGDIGSTAQAYAQAYLGGLAPVNEPGWSLQADAVTVNAYLGSDGLEPFLQAAQATASGIFALVKTSNPSSGELQDQRLASEQPVYELMAKMVHDWGQPLRGEKGYSSLGAVVGATYPAEAGTLRQLMPQSLFLVPGYGAQGGDAQDVLPAFNEDGLGALISSSRAIIFAYQKDAQYGARQFGAAAHAAAVTMRDAINLALAQAGKLPW